jgi:hypothetical protein
MKLGFNPKEIIDILNNNKNNIQSFELVDETYFLIRFNDGNRVEVEAEVDCGVFVTYVENE